jgi:hypothetical protein
MIRMETAKQTNKRNMPVYTASASAAAIPGKIEAENWTAMSGVTNETTSDTGGGLEVGYIDAGYWMDYSVDVASAGTYTVDFLLSILRQ